MGDSPANQIDDMIMVLGQYNDKYRPAARRYAELDPEGDILLIRLAWSGSKRIHW